MYGLIYLIMLKVIYTMNQNIYMLNPKLLKLFNFNRRQVCSFHISSYILLMNSYWQFIFHIIYIWHKKYIKLYIIDLDWVAESLSEIVS